MTESALRVVLIFAICWYGSRNENIDGTEEDVNRCGAAQRENTKCRTIRHR